MNVIVTDELGALIINKVFKEKGLREQLDLKGITLNLFLPQPLKKTKLKWELTKFLRYKNVGEANHQIQTIIVGLPSDRVTLHEELAKLYSSEVVKLRLTILRQQKNLIQTHRLNLYA